MSTENRVAIVTGSGTGVGAATCLQLAQKGWNVVVNYSRSHEEAEKTAAECREHGQEALVVKADVSSDEDCTKLVKQTVDQWGRVDALVNNAGRTKYCSYQDLDGLSKDDFLQLYEVNVVGAYQMTRACAHHLKAHRGAIVNVSSISGVSGVGSSIAYAASKGALGTLTMSLAHALAPEVRVNGIYPGFIDSRWNKGFLGDRYDEIETQMGNNSILKKVATAEDIARTVIYLIEDATASTAQMLVVDNGQLAHIGGM